MSSKYTIAWMIENHDPYPGNVEIFVISLISPHRLWGPGRLVLDLYPKLSPAAK